MDPNTQLLARLIHEERIQAALKRHKHGREQISTLRLPRIAVWNLPRNLRTRLGELLITVGTHLKPQIAEG